MWVDRKNGGEALVETVAAASFEASDHFGWVARADNRTTRAVAKKFFREEYKISKNLIEAQAYWVACRARQHDRYSSSIDRSSASSCPGSISEVITLAPAHRARCATNSGSSGTQRDHERLGQRLDHLGLLGHLRADRPLGGFANHDAERGAFAVAQRGQPR